MKFCGFLQVIILYSSSLRVIQFILFCVFHSTTIYQCVKIVRRHERVLEIYDGKSG